MASPYDETIAAAAIPPAKDSIAPAGKELVRGDADTLASPLGDAAGAIEEAAIGAASPMPPLSPSALTPGTRAGEYILDQFIAEGGFGAVYRARHATTGTAAAVKVLRPELVERLEVVLRFEREIEAILRLRHPNVIEIYAHGRLDDGRPYFAMELLRGVTLEDLLHARRRLPKEELLSILEPICAALAAAHERSIVHRDIKGSNVFLSEREGKRRVVLLDFGVAKILDEPGPGLTAPDQLVGTPAFMAPEQIEGKRVDTRTDVYALGVLTFYLLTGELPFIDYHWQALKSMILFASPPRPSSVAPVVNRAFDAPVLKAMSKKTDDRFASVGAFLEQIRLAATYREATEQRIVGERRALGIHIQIGCDPVEAYEEGDEDVYDDMEKSLLLVTKFLTGARFLMAEASGTKRLFILTPPALPDGDLEARRAAVASAVDLWARLGLRETLDPRVWISICVHAGIVELRAGQVDGPLLNTEAWVPDTRKAGVLVSREVLDGLAIETEPSDETKGFSRIV